MKKPLLLLAAMALAVTVLLLLLRGHDGAPADPAEGAAESVGQARPAAGAASGSAPADASSARGSDQREQVEAAHPSGAAAAASAPTATIRIAVQDAETQAPVADAEVWSLEVDPPKLTAEQRTEQMSWLKELQQDPEPRARASSQARHSDERGEAHVPKPAASAVVVVRKGDSYGEAWIRPGSEEPVTVLLMRDATVLVRAVDARGTPQIGVPVRVRPPGSPGQGSWGPSMSPRTTAPAGIVRLAHLQRWIGALARGRPAPASLVAFAFVPGVQAETAAFDPKRPPAEPLDLVVPECGSLVVKVADAGGEPCKESGWVSVVVNRDENNETSAELPAGEARFERVGLGVQLRVTGSVGDAECDPKDIPGPVRAGEEVTVTLQMSRSQPIVTGKALDAEGRPLAGRSLALLIGSAENSNDQVWSKTDQEGRFRFLPTKEWAGQKLDRLTLALHADAADPHQDTETGSFARATLPRTLVSGVQDLGELRFHEAPVLVAGVLVDDAGKPFPDAQLSLQRPSPPDDQGRRGLEELGLYNADVAVIRRDEGRFEIRGDVPETELKLAARHPDAIPLPPVGFTRGERDLRVVLARGGSIKVTLVLEPGMTGTEVQLSLRTPQGGEQRDNTRRWEGNGPGRARGPVTRTWRGLVPGTYEVVAKLAPENEVMKTVPGLVVTGGAACPDPRIAPLDLRGLARKIELTTVDARGRTVEQDGSLQVRNGQSVLVRRGKVQMWITRPTVDVTVSVGSFKKKAYAGIATDASLSLEAGHAVVVKLTGAELPADARLWLRSPDGMRRPPPGPEEMTRERMLEWEMQRSQGGNGFPGQRDAASGEWSFVVPEARSYPARLQVRAGAGWADVGGLVPAQVAVQDAAGAQRFEIAVTKEAVERAASKQVPARR